MVTPGEIEGLPPRPRIWSTHRHRGEAAGGWCGGHGPHGAQASDASSCRGSPSPGAAERDVVRPALPEVDRVGAQPAPCPPPHAYRASRRPSGASGTQSPRQGPRRSAGRIQRQRAIRTGVPTGTGTLILRPALETPGNSPRPLHEWPKWHDEGPDVIGARLGKVLLDLASTSAPRGGCRPAQTFGESSCLAGDGQAHSQNSQIDSTPNITCSWSTSITIEAAEGPYQSAAPTVGA